MEFLLGSHNLLFNEIVFWTHFELRLLVLDELLDGFVEEGFSHPRILGCLGVLNIQDYQLMHRVGIATIQVSLQTQLLQQEFERAVKWPGEVIWVVVLSKLN